MKLATRMRSTLALLACAACWSACCGVLAATAPSAQSAQSAAKSEQSSWPEAGDTSPAYFPAAAGVRSISGDLENASRVSLRVDKSAAPIQAAEGSGSTPVPRLPGSDNPALEADIARLRANAQAGSGRTSRAQGTASWLLGLLYLHGIGVTLNAADAAVWFERAYALGEPLASAGLAWCEIDGCRSAADPAAARRWLVPLRVVNLPRAQYFQWLIESRLSPLLLTAPGFRNEPSARNLPNRQLLLSAARAGDVQARVELAFESVSANRLAEAQDYFRSASGKSPAAAANAILLAERLRNTASPTSPGRNARPSASDNFARAERNHRGEGQSANYVEAIRLYQLAKNEGSVQAAKMLALIFSRPGADGQIDIAWMQQLAYVDLSKDVPTLDSATARQTLRRDGTPLLDLLPPPWSQYNRAAQR